MAGLNGKLDSLKNIIQVLSPGVIMLQETKLYRQGKVNLQGFVIFEKLRGFKGGGGLLTAVHENFSPVLIEDDDQKKEILIVDIKYDNEVTIRTMNCYGPQEQNRSKKNIEMEEGVLEKITDENKDFFNKLQIEIQSAKKIDNLICIQMDANSRLGRSVIKEDPNEKMSANGKLLFDILQSEDLILVNSTEKCQGTITRYRKTTKGIERSAIDFFIICRRLFEMLSLMVINEDRDFVMTKYSSRKGVEKITVSDHNLMWCKFNIQWSSFLKPEKRFMFNFKESESLDGFKQYNDRNEKLVQCLTNCEDIVSGGRKWFSELKDSIYKCFRKV